MKRIKRILMCFSLCLTLVLNVSIPSQAAVCAHASLKQGSEEMKIIGCVYQKAAIATCTKCNNVVYRSASGEQYTKHNFVTMTSSYKIYDGRTVKVVTCRCTNCGQAYSTSSVA